MTDEGFREVLNRYYEDLAHDVEQQHASYYGGPDLNLWPWNVAGVDAEDQSWDTDASY